MPDDSLTGRQAPAVHSIVFPGRLLEDLTPHARVVTAVVPFVSALFFRLLTGRSRLASILISASVTWFAINVLVAPLSFDMQQDLMRVQHFFR